MAFYHKYYDNDNGEDTDEDTVEEELGVLIYKSSATAKAIAKAKAERESTAPSILGINQNTHCVADSIHDGDGKTELSRQPHLLERQKNPPSMMDASHVATPKQSSLARPINNEVKTRCTSIDERHLQTRQQKTCILLNQEEWKPDQQKCTPTKECKTSQTRKTFYDWIADLKSYKEKNGHLNVSLEDDPTLAKFCLIMRWCCRNPEKAGPLKLDETRVAALGAIGFVWSPKQKAFEERIEDLKLYKEKHGHLNVSPKEDKRLARFCWILRTARKNPAKKYYKLDEARIASLDAIGFKWASVSNQLKKY